ncbi:fas apoptotic inhibitory molecule 1 [Ischnura elegans]|uniref:fas apoptotic inhibitory molecule 1 n=1 Tax=Ischnura elegans TaxID=197161 RepID=UPI001ED8BBD3|nr:fas apoptotic inhibitory molecule 1 [Ischnura elegans]
MSTDLVAYWEIPLNGFLHRIEFEHGTVTGKRCVRVDGKDIIKREWMFKLVGSEMFDIGGTKFEIRIDPATAFTYSYTLEVNGVEFEKFTEKQSKANKTWVLELEDDMYRVVLEKDTLDVWANGQRLETESEFVDDGSEMHFMLGRNPAHIKAVSSGRRREGIIYNLILNDCLIPEFTE